MCVCLFVCVCVCVCVQLQKSAVLQKTIDFIHRLESTIKKLQDENQRLREALGKGDFPDKVAIAFLVL